MNATEFNFHGSTKTTSICVSSRNFERKKRIRIRFKIAINKRTFPLTFGQIYGFDRESFSQFAGEHVGELGVNGVLALLDSNQIQISGLEAELRFQVLVIKEVGVVDEPFVVIFDLQIFGVQIEIT